MESQLKIAILNSKLNISRIKIGHLDKIRDYIDIRNELDQLP